MVGRKEKEEVLALIKEITYDIIYTLDEFSNINPERMKFVFGRSGGRTIASMAPVNKIENGNYTMYTMTVTPLFLECRGVRRGLLDRVSTIIHELYHISPEFRGALRKLSRHPNKMYHGNSRKDYDEKMSELARKYIMKTDRKDLLEMLEKIDW